MTTTRSLLPWIAGPVVLAAALRVARRASHRIDFRGRTVLIAGGSRGLGLVLAQEFAREGARVVIVARHAKELERARQAVLAVAEQPVSTVALDLTDREAVQGAIARIAEEHGRLDVLVHCAGTIQVGPLDHMRQEDFAQALAIHLWAPLHAIEAALPVMRRQGEGRIVNIASIAGRVPVPHLLPYTASKHALTGFSDAIGAELARENIRVTTVSPGLMRTGSHYNVLVKGRREAEHAWFAVADALPGLSVDVRRAARRIVDACRHGERRCTIGLPAKLAIAANALAPELVADLTDLVSRLLPQPLPGASPEASTGWESRSRWAPSWLTRAADRATRRHNQLPPHSREELAQRAE